jgi:type I restriction enzyme S subunit
MSEWVTQSTATLISKSVLFIGDGYRAKNSELSDFGIPFARAGNINVGFHFDNADYLPMEYANRIPEKVSKPGDIVFTSKGTVGRFAYVASNTPRFIFSPQLCCWRSLSETSINSRYLYYWMHSREFFEQVESLKGQTDMADYVSLSDQRRMSITLPPLPEQRAIASVLSSLDDKIDLLHRQNKTLEAMAETLFRQWFVEEAGEDWEEVTLDSQAKIAIGRTPPRKEFHWFSRDSTDIKWISIKDLADSGLYVLDTAEYLTQHAVENFNIPVIPKDTVVLSFKMTVGRVAITNESMLSNEAIAHFVLPDHTQVTTEYLYYYLKLFNYDQLGTTSTIVTSINSQMIRELPIKIPPKSTLRQFSVLAYDCFAKIRGNQNQIRTLKKLRDTLLPKLMSGEMRVQYD